MSFPCVVVVRLCQILISVVGSICPRTSIQLCKLSWEPPNRALQSVRIAFPVELFGNSVVVFGSPVKYVPSSEGAYSTIGSVVKSCGGDETAAETARLGAG